MDASSGLRTRRCPTTSVSVCPHHALFSVGHALLRSNELSVILFQNYPVTAWVDGLKVKVTSSPAALEITMKYAFYAGHKVMTRSSSGSPYNWFSARLISCDLSRGRCTASYPLKRLMFFCSGSFLIKFLRFMTSWFWLGGVLIGKCQIPEQVFASIHVFSFIFQHVQPLSVHFICWCRFLLLTPVTSMWGLKFSRCGERNKTLRWIFSLRTLLSAAWREDPARKTLF